MCPHLGTNIIQISPNGDYNSGGYLFSSAKIHLRRWFLNGDDIKKGILGIPLRCFAHEESGRGLCGRHKLTIQIRVHPHTHTRACRRTLIQKPRVWHQTTVLLRCSIRSNLHSAKQELQNKLTKCTHRAGLSQIQMQVCWAHAQGFSF